jgi:hypothetical protein
MIIVFAWCTGSDSKVAYVSDKVPVANQDLTSIKRSCPFATGDSVNSLSPNQKRNIMYWWYATNIFLIYGKGNCGPLPEYLVYAI